MRTYHATARSGETPAGRHAFVGPDLGPDAPVIPRIFLINLDRSPDRLAYMQGQLSVPPYTRVVAVDGRPQVPRHLASQFDVPGSTLASAEIGCYASHLLAMQLILDTGLSWGIILEDDAVLPDNFWMVAVEAAFLAPQPWDVIHLCAKPIKHWWRKRPTRTVAVLGFGRKPYRLVSYWRRPVRASAYLISAEGARKFLMPRARVRPIDEEFRATWDIDLNFFGVAPPLTSQNKHLVSLIGERPKGRLLRPKSWVQRWQNLLVWK